MRILLGGAMLLCGLLHAQAFRITSVTPDGTSPNGLIYPGDSVGLTVTAVRENITMPIQARLTVREINATTGAQIRESTATASDQNGTYRFQLSHRLPAAHCYPSCKPGETIASTDLKVRLELTATLDYYVQLTTGLDRRTATSTVTRIPVTYPTIESISVNSAPLNTYLKSVLIAAKGVGFTSARGLSVQVLRANDYTKQIYAANPGNSDPFEYWLVPPAQQQLKFDPRVVSDDVIEVSVNAIVGVAAFNSEAPTLSYIGPYDIVVRWQPPDGPANTFRGVQHTPLTGRFSVTEPLKNDSVKISKLEMTFMDPDPAKRQSATWTPGGENQLTVGAGSFIQVKFTGTYNLSRYAAALLWFVMRDKATKQSLYMPWDFARNTAGKERDIIEQGYGRHTPITFTYRLPAAIADLEFFVVMTPQDHPTPTNYDRAPTVPFGETFAFSQPVAVSWTKPGDVAIDHIEVVQVLQTADNSYFLVEGKNTVARVFLKVEPKTADQVAQVSAKLTSPKKGTPRRLNGPITAVGELDRAKFEHSINFALPEEWLERGELVLDAEVELPKGFIDTKLDNNKKSVTVRFIETPFKDRQFTVGYIPYCYKPTPDAERRCPEGDLGSFGAWIRLLFPLAEGRIRYGRLGTRTPTVQFPLTSGSASRVMASLNRFYRMADEKRPGRLDQLVAWLPRITDAPADPARDRKLPIGRANTLWNGGTGRVAFVQDTSTSEITLRTPAGVRTGTGKDVVYSHLALAHEVAHNYGLHHPATPDSCGSGDPITDWPKDASGNSLPATTSDIGFDTVARKVKDANLKDLMSYCAPPASNIWLSFFHYNQLLTGMQNARPSPTSKGSERMAAGGTLAIVGGMARRDGSAGKLDPIVRLDPSGTPDAPDPNGNHCFVFRDDTSVLGRHCFRLQFLDDDPHEETENSPTLDEEFFSFQVDLPPGTNRVDLVAGSNELATLRAGTAVPTVSITSPQPGDKWSGGGMRTLAWTASAPGGAALSYTALYSNDGGASWLPLELDLSETSLTFDTSELMGGTNVFFRVIASSGFDSAEATVGPIELAQTPKIEVPSEPIDFGHVLVGLDTEKTFSLKSTGSGPMNVNGMAVSGAAGYSVVSPRGSFPVMASTSEAVTLRFEASQAGVQLGTLAIESDDPANPIVRVPLRARAVNAYIPEIAVSPATIDFGSVNVGQTRELPVLIRNVGSAALNVSAITSNQTAVTVTASTPLTLAPGAQQSVTVVYKPVSAGALTAALTIASDDPDRPSIPLALTGRAVSPTAPSIAVAPSTLAFGSVATGSTRDLTLTLSNTGTAELAVNSITSNNARFTIPSLAVPFRIAAAGQQAITVRFTPAAAQAESGQLTIASNDPARPSLAVDLSGTGTTATVNAPVLTVSATLDLGSTPVGQAKDAPLLLRNTGTAALNITAISLVGAGFTIVPAPSLPVTIAAGGQQTLTLRMTPTAAGAQSAELRLTSNDPARPTVTVALSGTATASTTPNPLPLLDALVPATVTSGGGAFTLTVTGSRFVNGASIQWNGTAKPTTFVSATELRAAIPASDIAAAATIEITVTNPAPGGGKSTGRQLIVGVANAPVVLTQQFNLESCPLMTAVVSALDRSGNVITSLGNANFKCTEDGQPVNCAAEPGSIAGTPLSAAIVLDTSVTGGEFEAVRSAAASLINQLGPDDRVAFIQAASTVLPIGGFTNNRSSINGVLSAMTISGSGTALYDAIEFAVRNTASQSGRRRAVVVFSGNENNSGTIRDANALFASARTQGVPVFILSFGASAQSATTSAAMQQLALETAGRFNATSGNLLLRSEGTGLILANQHIVSWSAPNRDGAMHAFGLTLASAQGSAANVTFYRACKQ